MKTAISIPDEIFEAADRTAKRLGVSRSQLYTKAVSDYLDRHPAIDVTAVLDEVYCDNDSKVNHILRKMQSLSLEQEDW